MINWVFALRYPGLFYCVSRYVLSAAISVLILLPAVEICSAASVDRVIAIVNGDVITMSDYGRFVSRSDPAADREKIGEQFLKSLLEERLILQEAMRKGYDATDEDVNQSMTGILSLIGITEKELEARLMSDGINLIDYRRLLKDNIISLKCIEKEVNAKVIVSDSELMSMYEKQKALFMESPASAVVMAIVMKLGSNPSVTEITDLKIKSLKIYSEIKNGELFERQVHRYADDSIKKLDGILGEFVKGALIPVLDEKIFSMKEGDVSEPVWTKDGVYILKIVKRTEVMYTPFEAVREKVYSKVYEEKREELLSIWMKQLWEKSSIEIPQQ